MPQKVIISTGYSEKNTENYCSRQHSIGLEIEVNVNGSTDEVEVASNKLFALCRKIVSGQKSVNIDTLLNPAPAPAATAPSANQEAPATPQQPRPASSKQIRYILQIAKKNGLTEAEIKNLPAHFDKADFSSLTSQEASDIIDHLTNLGQKKAA